MSDGAALLEIGAGPLHTTVPLTPLAPDLALLEGGEDGPWRQRVCLQFLGDELRLVTNRSPHPPLPPCRDVTSLR